MGGTFTGYQQSAVYNIVGKDFRGLQTAGAGNVVGGNFKGVQFGTTFNFIGKQLKGFQWSGFNVCGESKGIQMAWGNIAQVNRGLQVGIVNIAEQQYGVPFGLINISDEGDINWQSYVSNFADFVTAAKFRSNNFVSSIEFGVKDQENDGDGSAILGFHYGYRLPIKRFGFEADFGYFHIINNLENTDSDIPNSFALELRFSTTYRINSWVELFGGFGGNTTADYPENEDDVDIESKDSYLFFAGINLF